MKNQKVSAVGDFVYGKNVQETVLNAFYYGLDYSVKPMGIENSFGPICKNLLSTNFSSNNRETLENIRDFRKEPDAVVISPKGNVMMLEIKARRVGTLEEQLTNNYYIDELMNIFSRYRNTRLVCVDLEKRKLGSISGLEPLDIESQTKNWLCPWTWLEGLNGENDYIEWSNEFIFSPLIHAAQKIISKSSAFEINEDQIPF